MITRLKSWLRSILGRRRLEDDMEAEVQFHIDARTADLIRRASPPKKQNARPVSNSAPSPPTKTACAPRSASAGQTTSWCDLRYAARILRKSPGFTAIAVGSLALAIGANTTIFSVANEMLYERLGVPHPEQLRLLAFRGDKNVVVHSTWGDLNPLPGGGRRFTPSLTPSTSSCAATTTPFRTSSPSKTSAASTSPSTALRRPCNSSSSPATSTTRCR